MDVIDRFHSGGKLCVYAGLVPTTQTSGGKLHHDKLLPSCNKWLRWAFPEAAWVAIGCSPYLGQIYRDHWAQGEIANTAIMIGARRSCQIVWSMLGPNRGSRFHP